MRALIRIGLIVSLLPVVGACGLKKPAPPDASVVDAAAPADDGGADAATDDDAGPAPMLDAGPVTVTHIGPNGLVGTYEGSVHEGNIHYGMTAVLADKTGTISYTAPFDCKGTWTFVSHNPATKTYTYKEHITVQTGKRKCADGETATVVDTGSATWSYSESSAHASLSKTH